MNELTVSPQDQPPDPQRTLEGSSLATATAMVAAALADGTSEIHEMRDDPTSRAMATVLDGLGAILTVDQARKRVRIRGCAGHLPEQKGELAFGPTALAGHLSLALCCLGFGEYRFDGYALDEAGPTARHGVRSIILALRDLGAQIGHEDEDGRLPITLRPRGLRGGRTTLNPPWIEALVALLTVAPYARTDVLIATAGPTDTVRAAVACDVLRSFGVSIVHEDYRRFIVAASQRYSGIDYAIPPDPIEAATAWLSAAVGSVPVTVTNAHPRRDGPLQVVLEGYERLGCTIRSDDNGTTVEPPTQSGKLTACEIDMNPFAELLPPLAVASLFADGPTRFKGIRQDDRRHLLCQELSRLGAVVGYPDPRAMVVDPPTVFAWQDLDAHDDAILTATFAAAVRATADQPVCISQPAEPLW